MASKIRKQNRLTKSYLSPGTRVGMWLNGYLLTGMVTHTDSEGFTFVRWDYMDWDMSTPELCKRCDEFLVKLGGHPPSYCKPSQLFLLEEAKNG